MRIRVVITGFCLLLLSSGCANHRGPDLGLIYNDAAKNIGIDRNPVIVIPGILGSKLEEPGKHTPVWGAFGGGAANPETPEGARLIALPMAIGVPLTDLHDSVVATEVVDTLKLNVGLILGLEISAYVDILKTLAAGKYRDQSLGESGAVDYGGLHYTCFQFAYDWRRDIPEQAAELHKLVLNAQALSKTETGRDGRVDVVAHSMGGLVLRYYLRYGPEELSDDGSLPPLTWEGARHVEHAILVGTPSAGSALSLVQLVEGINFAALITPTYSQAVLGTMPSVYQLLPRPRHARVIDAATGESIDILDPDVWRRYEWGLADPDQDTTLRYLLPEINSAEDRRAVAMDHLAKSLARARRVFEALDRPGSPPHGTSVYLTAGDARATPDLISVGAAGELRIVGTAPGDDTVTRASALMDERVGSEYVPHLRSPVRWSGVQFLSADHLGLTRDPAFVNFLLYILLEHPRDSARGAARE